MPESARSFLSPASPTPGFCSEHGCGQDYTHKAFRKADARASPLFPTQRSLFCFQCSSHSPRLQVPVSHSSPGQQGGDSTYRETCAGASNALFCPLLSSCRLCWPDVLVCEAEVLCGLPRGKDSEVRACRASLQNLGCGGSAACDGCLHGVARESPTLLGAREEVWETREVQRHWGQGNCRNRLAASAAPAHSFCKRTRSRVCAAVCTKLSFYINKAYCTHTEQGCPTAGDG